MKPETPTSYTMRLPVIKFGLLLLVLRTALVAAHPGPQEEQINNEIEADDDSDPTVDSGYFEGDIAGVQGRNAMLDRTKLWAEGEVPYTISSQFSGYSAGMIRKAMKGLEGVSCVRFVERSAQPDYVSFIVDQGCYSTVGKGGGRQDVSLASECLKPGVILHELLHTLGFWHEQSRADRDDYVTVRWQNIRKGMEKNFNKYPWSEIQDLSQGYDIASIMHYGPRAFARNSFVSTLEPKNRRDLRLMGQRRKLTDKDVAKVNALYRCSAHPPAAPTVDDHPTLLSSNQDFRDTFRKYLDKLFNLG